MGVTNRMSSGFILRGDAPSLRPQCPGISGLPYKAIISDEGRTCRGMRKAEHRTRGYSVLVDFSSKVFYRGY